MAAAVVVGEAAADDDADADDDDDDDADADDDDWKPRRCSAKTAMDP